MITLITKLLSDKEACDRIVTALQKIRKEGYNIPEKPQ